MKGVVVFAITYALVATRRLRIVKIDRPAGALVGAVLAVAVGAVTPHEAATAVDHTTIVLLFAVMGMGAFLSLDGFFDRAGALVVARARTARRLVGATVWGAGALAAVVTNDAVCVLAAPLVVGWIERHKVPRVPMLLALATGANTGSVATLVGNPQNMLCGSLGRLSFAAFALRLMPVAVIGLALNHALLVALYRRELDAPLEGAPRADELAPRSVVTARSGLTLSVIGASVAIYSAGYDLAFTALGGFALLLLVHREAPGRIWEKIDWSVLLFFAALFVAVDAFARSAVPGWVFERVSIAAPGPLGALRAAAIFLVGSNVVTNVPFILVVRDQMVKLPDATLGWELLAMASTFAGNLTLLGSVANVIVAEKAERIGGLRFGEYLKGGLPIALTTTLAGTLVLTAVHAVFPSAETETPRGPIAVRSSTAEDAQGCEGAATEAPRAVRRSR